MLYGKRECKDIRMSIIVLWLLRWQTIFQILIKISSYKDPGSYLPVMLSSSKLLLSLANGFLAQLAPIPCPVPCFRVSISTCAPPNKKKKLMPSDLVLFAVDGRIQSSNVFNSLRTTKDFIKFRDKKWTSYIQTLETETYFSQYK